MAYFDGIDDQQQTPDAEAEARRKVLSMIASGGKAPLLGQPAGVPIGSMMNPTTPLNPGTRGYDLAVSSTAQPRIPPRNTSPLVPPTLSAPSAPSSAPLGGGMPAPIRPNVAPTREDYPAKPEVSGWKKYLGLGLAALSGPQSAGPLAERILHGQRDDANQRFGQATQDWERQQGDEARAATTDEARARAESLRHPKPPTPEKPENLQQVYADAVADAQSRGVDPAKDPKVQQIADAITSLQKQPAPPKDNKAVAGTIKGKPAWGVQTDSGWIDPQTKKSIPEFAPAPNYAQVAPSLKTVDILDPATGLPTVRTLGGQNIGVSGTGAYGHEAAQAGAVSRAGDDLISAIKAHKNKLGNPKAIIESAILNTPWADPETAELRAQIATFAALQPSMHGFRGMNAVQQFEKVLGGIPNNPDALIAAIQGIKRTAGAINPSLNAAPSKGGFKEF